jgi:peptide/nickel transport system substrate-binding protein
MRSVKRGKLGVLALLVALGLFAAACSTEDSGGGGAEEGGEGGEATETLAFGTSADPVVLDGALVSDGESLRAIDQMFEGLVTLEPGGTEVVPGLATDWEISEDGLSYTFNLQEGVTFHDGEEFNAEAVCYNFDRWYNFKGSLQNPAASYYWQTVFGGFSDGKTESLYESCEAEEDLVVDGQPCGARGVRCRRGQGRCRGNLLAGRHLRDRAPDRHRAIHVRRMAAR